MYKETIDFYDSSSVKLYNLDKNMRYQLSVLEHLDNITKRHCINVGNLSCRICQYLRLNKKFTLHTTICGYLHDIGKMFIPKEILEKPGRLTDEEYEVMKTHTTLGFDYCNKDFQLKLYSEGPLYHHEALNGTGYPQGLTKKDIPFSAQVIRVADEYDSIVTKRHYTTHVNISETLKELIKDATPDFYAQAAALDQLSTNSKWGKVSPTVLKALFKAVIEDTLYEISCVVDYIDYLKDNVKRLELISKYKIKMESTDKQKKKDYYAEGINLLLQSGENIDNYTTILEEYKAALVVREKRVDDLYNEIKIIKKLKV